MAPLADTACWSNLGSARGVSRVRGVEPIRSRWFQMSAAKVCLDLWWRQKWQCTANCNVKKRSRHTFAPRVAREFRPRVLLGSKPSSDARRKTFCHAKQESQCRRTFETKADANGRSVALQWYFVAFSSIDGILLFCLTHPRRCVQKE